MSWKINILIAAMLFAVQSCQQPQPEQEEVTSYAHPESIIEAAELIANYGNYRIIDLRKPEEYAQGHLPQAIQVWRTDITDSSYAYGGMMPTKEQMELLLGSLGVSADDTIVIYDDKAECDAARLWWILKFYGHKSVKLLNGGLPAWQAQNGELTSELSVNQATEFRFAEVIDSSIYVSYNLVKASQYDSLIVLLDTRGNEEFAGAIKKDGAARAGHIEGAENLDWATAVDYNGNKKFRSVVELRELYSTVGIDDQSSVITYCHSGVRSAHTLFVLTQLLGYRNIKNYDGSWTEWSHLTSN